MNRGKISDSAIPGKMTDEVDTKNCFPKQVELKNDDTSTSMPLMDADFWPLEEPYIHFMLAKSHIKPAYNLVLPSKLYPLLPSTTGLEMRVPTTIEYRRRTWETTLIVQPKVKKFGYRNWKIFVDDNNLRVGDVVFWELRESSNQKVKFRLQMLRADFPAEVEAGMTMFSPIIIED